MMLTKVLLILFNVFLILQARVRPQAAEEEESSAHDGVVYGPEPQPLPPPPPQPVEKIILTEVTEPTALMETGRPGSKLAEASHTLNTILSKYDPKLRPGIGEKPTVVTVEITVNSLGPLSIVDMEYAIDIIFCQTWYDERLRYNNSFETLVLQGNVVSQLWIPDTFFRNSKKIEEHAITLPNQMVRIHKDGKVLYTVRMTIDVRCSLHMLKFPLDSHSCPLSFSSFSYTESEMIYKWADFHLEINEKNSWKLFQFQLTGQGNKSEIDSTPYVTNHGPGKTDTIVLSCLGLLSKAVAYEQQKSLSIIASHEIPDLDGNFMIMTFFFNMSRQFGYVAFQNFVPSSVTTMLSWVSFWIKKESAPARTSLGITSVLTVTTLGTFSRKNFPRVSYITVLDFYIAICFVFCFCALMEFAVLNFLTYNRAKAHNSPTIHRPWIGSLALARSRARARARARQQQEVFVCEIVTTEGSDGEERQHCSVQQLPGSGDPQSLCDKLACFRCFKRLKKYFCMIPDCEGHTWQQGCLRIHIYRLDNYSRVVFPVSFFIFNVVYWLVCLNL